MPGCRAATCLAAEKFCICGLCVKHGSSFAAVHWWHMTFVVLPGRPAHPGIHRGDVADVWKSSGRWRPSRFSTSHLGQNSGKPERAITGRELAAGESARWRRIRANGSLPHWHMHLVDNLRLPDHYLCGSGVSTSHRADGCFCRSGQAFSADCPHPPQQLAGDQFFFARCRLGDLFITRWWVTAQILGGTGSAVC